jgi:penicillin amidase
MDGYRQTAILESLAARRDWDVAATLALQTDVTTRAWRDVRDIVVAIAPGDSLGRTGLEMLRGWDGEMSIDSPAAAVYVLFLAEMVVRTAKAKAPRSWEWALGREFNPLSPVGFFALRRTGRLVRLLHEQPAGWFPRPWPDEMAAALSAAVATLTRRFGADPARWGWGRIRPLLMHHPLGRGRLLGRIFNRGPVPCGGDSDTVAQASVFPLDPLAPADNFPSLRVVIDVGAWGNSRYVLPGGQSGNPLSPHYDDQFPLHRRGEAIPIPWTDAEVRSATRHRLLIAPAR